MADEKRLNFSSLFCKNNMHVGGSPAKESATCSNLHQDAPPMLSGWHSPTSGAIMNAHFARIFATGTETANCSNAAAAKKGCRFSALGLHKPCKPDARKVHPTCKRRRRLSMCFRSAPRKGDFDGPCSTSGTRSLVSPHRDPLLDTFLPHLKPLRIGRVHCLVWKLVHASWTRPNSRMKSKVQQTSSLQKIHQNEKSDDGSSSSFKQQLALVWPNRLWKRPQKFSQKASFNLIFLILDEQQLFPEKKKNRLCIIYKHMLPFGGIFFPPFFPPVCHNFIFIRSQ